MAKLEIPYEVGSKIWTPGGGMAEVRVECPECCGTKVVTMELGNGERHSLDCRCCQAGYESPRGWVWQRTFESDPVEVELTDIEISAYSGIRYLAAGAWVDLDMLFESKADCETRCAELRAERQANEDRIIFNNLKSKRRDCAWSVHYWRRRVKDLERDLERARAFLTKSATVTNDGKPK
ncbi:MAG: hypothetical protein GY766_21600 [Herbaspirillum sp.]|uniref:hypothetical protein n=1 Tax=Herbaspirillum sp. TaxID=1890675 RepID=UPI00258EAC1D|nr:hypothetical protein [Herbaspirillum sp.]MCP3657452.1 hypothetical protein [Herbaspirillum sp.]